MIFELNPQIRHDVGFSQLRREQLLGVAPPKRRFTGGRAQQLHDALGQEAAQQRPGNRRQHRIGDLPAPHQIRQGHAGVRQNQPLDPVGMPPDQALRHSSAEGRPQHPHARDTLRVQNCGDAIRQIVERPHPWISRVDDAEPRRQCGRQIEAHVVDQLAAGKQQKRSRARAADPVFPFHAGHRQRFFWITRAEGAQPFFLGHGDEVFKPPL